MVFFKANYTIWTIFRGRNFATEFSILTGFIITSTTIATLRSRGYLNEFGFLRSKEQKQVDYNKFTYVKNLLENDNK